MSRLFPSLSTSMTLPCLVHGALAVSPVYGQRGREVLSGLLQDSIESELSKQQQQEQEPDRQQVPNSVQVCVG